LVIQLKLKGSIELNLLILSLNGQIKFLTEMLLHSEKFKV